MGFLQFLLGIFIFWVVLTLAISAGVSVGLKIHTEYLEERNEKIRNRCNNANDNV